MAGQHTANTQQSAALFKRRVLLTLGLSLAIAAGALLGWGVDRFQRPGPLTEARVVVLAEGLGLKQMAARLRDAGAISSSDLFVAVVRLSGDGRRLRAGEYRIERGASMREIRDLLRSGRTVVHRFTVAEGLTVAQVVDMLRAEPALSGTIDSLPPEGSLLPETYHFALGDGRRDVLERMTAAMAETLAELWRRRAPELPLADPREAVILASMVEKETALPAERGHIAGVFLNRLRRGMRLQSDPTVVYGIGAGAALARPLSRADLERKTPYNTYTNDGLPPGPIANPGRAALAAVLHPADTRDLYFVADGNGGHAFAETLRQHRANVRKWRRIKAARDRDN